jgi:tetratricopeptide (TPR) repeat protein
MRARGWLVGMAAAVVAGSVAVFGWHAGWWRGGSESTQALAPQYVGAASCAGCHAAEHAAWTDSHHDLAMQEATDATVLGDFSGAQFAYAGVTSEFFRRDGRFIARTDGPDGALAEFEIRYAFGVEPLQQYLIELPGGRLQALSIAWDTRPAAQGGQRWFHLYPGEQIRHDDELHWTGPQQNWNHMCAECHSTDLQRNYDAATSSYSTSWSEIDVACEACHGPGSAHVAAAGKGQIVRFDERRGVSWAVDAATGKPARSVARTSQRELDTCARCHSRRGQIWDDYEPGRPIGETHRLALLDAGLYFADGQIRDEVYEYGSFVQSRMHQAGVACSDCHDPHSLTLRAPGAAVCATCHQADRYASREHHRHEPGSAGSDCLECHMPGRNYMVVDHRRDHSLRVPRPDLAALTGAPDPCTACHRDRKPAWAAARLREWLGRDPAGLQDYAEALHAGDTAAAGARQQLLRLAGDAWQPGIARASALVRLDRIAGPEQLGELRKLLGSSDPLLRRAAVAAYRNLPPEMRGELFALLDDPVRDVRLEAVPLLADLPDSRLDPAQRARRERAIDEYAASQRVNAERPESQVNLGLLWAALGRAAEAEAALQQAVRLDPRFVPAAVNLADLYRAIGREAEAAAVLREGLRRSPQAAALHHALGLLLVRTDRRAEALGELKLAAEQAPGEARYSHVYAVALADAGRPAEAIQVLRSVLMRQPNDRDTLWTLANYQLNAGDRQGAARTAARLSALEPDDPAVRDFVAGLK